MSRNSRLSHWRDILSSFIAGILLIPLVILKQIGELLITTLLYIFSSLISSYKFILYLIFGALNLIKKAILLPFGLLKFKLKKKTKNKIASILTKVKFFLLGILCILSFVLYNQFNSFIKNGFTFKFSIKDGKGNMIYGELTPENNWQVIYE